MYLTTQDRIKIAIFHPDSMHIPCLRLDEVPMNFSAPSALPAVCFCHRGVSAAWAGQMLWERGPSSSLCSAVGSEKDHPGHGMDETASSRTDC